MNLLLRRWRIILTSLLLIGAAAVACGEGPPGVVRVQLDWLPNTNHTGIYAAQAMGWYEDEGIVVEILPYSGGNGDLLVIEGVADVAFSFPSSVPGSRARGLDVVSIAAVLQHNPTEIAVLADGPIERLRDLDGQLYGGFGLPYEDPQWRAVIRADGGEGSVTGIVLDTAAYEALYAGRVQAVETFVTWEGIEAHQRGIALRTWKYTEFGIPDFPGVVLVAGRELTERDPDLLARFLRATIRGYEFAAAAPEDAARIMIEQAGEDVFPSADLVFASARLLADEYYLDERGRWGSQTLEQWRGYTEWLYEQDLLEDVDGDPLTAAPDYGAHFTSEIYEAALAGLKEE